MNTTNQEGRASGAAPGQREKITFDTGVPVVVTLEFNPPPRAREGKFGDQYMYFLDSDRIMFVDPPLHERIVASGAKAGSRLAILKRIVRNGTTRRTEWDVAAATDSQREALDLSAELAAELAAAAPPLPARTRTLPRRDPLPHVPAEKFVGSEEHQNLIREGAAAVAPQKAAAQTAARSNPMAEALQQALDAVQITGFQARSEDIRAIAITIYIQAFGGGKR